MPNVGPFDKRRRTRRCEQCRISRTKCVGGRPCNACESRSTRCENQKPHGARQAVVLHPQIPVVTPLPSTPRPPRSKSQARSMVDYLKLAYQVIGRGSSSWTDPFATNDFLRLVRDNENVGHAVIAIGAAHLAHSEPTACSPGEIDLVGSIQRNIYAKYLVRIKDRDAHRDSSLLPLTILLCLLQLMTAESNNIALHILDEFTTHIVASRGPDVFSTDLERGFLPIYRFLQVLGALQRDQSTKIADWEWQPTGSEPGQIVLSNESSQINDIFSSICTLAITFAELNVANQAWVQDEKLCLSEFRSYSAYLDRGRGIIKQAHQLIQQITQLERTPFKPQDTQPNLDHMIASNCLILKIGILRTFSHPAWQIDPLPLPPDLSESKIQEYATSALDHLEKRIGFSGLESVAYLSHLMALVLEIGDVDGRRRVLRLLERVRGMGFRVATMCVGDAVLVWETFGPKVADETDSNKSEHMLES
ncbi:hypothetical protein DL98DRAFT_510547 [Cadophora sp. DSE1049]|nr:hypothetical protein DL98DRAFT_510547 [Cadophora sp. DSE1049]